VDTNADGTLTEAGRFQNVTVALYADTNGNGVLDGSDNLVGTTITDSSGNYSFNNLPNGTYLVDVTDDNKSSTAIGSRAAPTRAATTTARPIPIRSRSRAARPTPPPTSATTIDPAGLGNFVWTTRTRMASRKRVSRA